MSKIIEMQTQLERLETKIATMKRSLHDTEKEYANLGKRIKVHSELASLTEKEQPLYMTSRTSSATALDRYTVQRNLDMLKSISMKYTVYRIESKPGRYPVGLKLRVNDVAESLTKSCPDLFETRSAASMHATRLVRMVYEFCHYRAKVHPDRYNLNLIRLEWHSSGQTSYGRATRGTGFVVFTEAGISLFEKSLAKCVRYLSDQLPGPSVPNV